MNAGCVYVSSGIMIALMHVILGKDLQLVGNLGDCYYLSMESRVEPGSAFWSRGSSESQGNLAWRSLNFVIVVDNNRPEVHRNDCVMMLGTSGG